MFSRNTEKLESVIGANSRLKGEVDTKGTLRVDGVVEGNVNADWVVVGEKGLIKGDISARGIVVGGKIEGNVRAKEIVEIRSKGQISGEVVTAKLSIAEGAIFDGRSSMHREESKLVELVAKEKTS